MNIDLLFLVTILRSMNPDAKIRYGTTPAPKKNFRYTIKNVIGSPVKRWEVSPGMKKLTHKIDYTE